MSAERDRTHLLIPIHVDALVVGGNGSNSEAPPLKPFTVSAAPNFSLLKDAYKFGVELRQPKEPLKPESLLSHPPWALEPGIHLHFRLPAAAAHWDPKREPGFPRIPNRWLVQRYYKAESGSLHTKAWLIRGDELAPATGPAVVLPVFRAAATKSEIGTVFPCVPKDYETPMELRRTGWAQVIWDGDQRQGDYDYRTDNGKAAVELTAVTGGDAGFSAHYPACRSILGLYDDLKDVPKKAELSYLVTGWYSGTQDDPWSGLVATLVKAAEARSALAAKLAREADEAKKKGIAKELSELKKVSEMLDEWMKDRGCVRDFGKIGELGGPELAKALPAGILCHGSVKNVRRQTKEKPFEEFAKLSNYWVDLGNTSAEAFAARVAKVRSGGKKQDADYINLLEDLVTALQTGLCSQGSNAAEMDAELHRQDFAAVAGGKVWVIQQAASAPAKNVPPSPPAALPALPADLQEQLDELNRLERECDRCERLLRDYRWELYAVWHRWTDAKQRSSRQLEKVLEPNLQALKKLVEVYKTKVEEAKSKRDERAKGKDSLGKDSLGKNSLGKELELRSKKEGAPVQYSLAEQPAAPFYVPKDPVLLLTGPAAGALGTRERPKSVKVRVTEEELQSFFYDRDQLENVQRNADVLLQELKVSPQYLDAIPPWSRRLLKEALLLDDLETPGKYKKTNPSLLRDSASGPYGKYETTKETGGVPPDTFSRFSWVHNPWIPLYLYWEVSWQADSWQANEVSGALTKHWTLQHSDEHAREHGAIPVATYRRNTELIPRAELTNNPKAVEYQGLSFVGHPLFDLQYERAEASGTSLLKLMKQIETSLGARRTLMISQPLVGLHDALIMRRAGDQLPLLDYSKWDDPEEKHPLYLDPIGQLLGQDFQPDSSPATPVVDASDLPPFCPLRTGLLQLKNLWIIDAFGRVNPVGLPRTPEESPAWCQSGRLEVGPPSSDPLHPLAVRLHPRFCRPLRLEFTGISAEAFGAGPVCGWVVLNRFDQNLVLYAANGQPAGILQKRFDKFHFDQQGGTRFYWVGVPGASGESARDEAKLEDIQDRLLRDSKKVQRIQNPYLRDFAEFVLALDFAAGERFAERINEAVQATEQRVPEDNPLIAVLIGRPLALVRAELRLEMDGLPALDQGKSWTADPKSGQPSLEEFLKTSLTNGTGLLPKQSMETSGVEKVRCPVRLGDRRSTNDGLVGFFKGGPGSRPFYSSWGFGFGTESYGALQDLELDCGNPLQVTLLMDPQARVHATSGVLPRGFLELPAAQLKGAKQLREVFFQTAPVLGTATTPHVPKPSDDYGQWSWAYRPNVTGWAEDPEMVSAANLAGPAVGWPVLTEGWLKLKLEPVLIRSLWMKAPAQKPQRNDNVILAWSLQDADSAQLFQLQPDGTEQLKKEWHELQPEGREKTGLESPPFEWPTGPLESADTTFRIRAYNKAGYEDYKDIRILTEE